MLGAKASLAFGGAAVRSGDAFRATLADLVREKLIREQNVVFVSEGIKPALKEADIEDLLEVSTYEALVNESYSKELKGKPLILRTNILRIAKRVETALDGLGIKSHKTRPTRLLSKMASDPKRIVTADVGKRFEALFSIINSAPEETC